MVSFREEGEGCLAGPRQDSWGLAMFSPHSSSSRESVRYCGCYTLIKTTFKSRDGYTSNLTTLTLTSRTEGTSVFTSNYLELSCVVVIF